jgi:hypothetical protein
MALKGRGMSGWRLRVGSLWLLIGCYALPQTAKQNCDGAGTMELSVAFDNSYSSANLTYRFANPNAFSAAKIEVWDRPKILSQLSQLRTFFGFFALIFVVKPCVFIVAL